jgi:hypothetical protein
VSKIVDRLQVDEGTSESFAWRFVGDSLKEAAGKRVLAIVKIPVYARKMSAATLLTVGEEALSAICDGVQRSRTGPFGGIDATALAKDENQHTSIWSIPFVS